MGILGGNTLGYHFMSSAGFQVVEEALDVFNYPFTKLFLHGLLPYDPKVGKAHPVGRQNPGVGVEKNPGHTEIIGYPARMLSAGGAKAAQSIFGNVITPLD